MSRKLGSVNEKDRSSGVTLTQSIDYNEGESNHKNGHIRLCPKSLNITQLSFDEKKPVDSFYEGNVVTAAG